MKMKQSIIALAFAAVTLPLTVFAGGSSVALQSANIDLHDKESLQRGAKHYINNCQGCHSLKFSRYNRVAADIGLTDDQVKENLIFTRNDKGEATKVGSLMTNTMDDEAAAKWFGTAPPDLSLIARSRGTNWVYTYLNSFYADSSRPFGVNNTVFPDVGMPHVLADLQGDYKAVYQYDVVHHGHNIEASFDTKEEAEKMLQEKLMYEVYKMDMFGERFIESFKSKEKANAFVEEKTKYNVILDTTVTASFENNADAQKYVQENSAKNAKYKIASKTAYSAKESHKVESHIKKLEMTKKGSLDKTEYRQVTRDITNFLTYVAEPAQVNRKSYGWWVLLFLAVFFVFAYLLKKEFWKDVH